MTDKQTKNMTNAKNKTKQIKINAKNETANLTNQQLSYQNSKIKLLLDCNKATKKLQTRGGRNVYNNTIASLLQRKKIRFHFMSVIFLPPSLNLSL